MSKQTSELDQSKTSEMKNKRNRLFLMLFITIVTIAIMWGLYYHFVSSRYVWTDNAYVGAEISQVTSQIEATVKDIKVNDADHVKLGDILVEFDNTDARLAFESAKADLEKAEADANRSKLHFQRFEALSKSGAVSAEDINKSENDFKAAKAMADAARVAVEKANVNYERTVVRSPVDGIIAKRLVQLGQRVMSGTQLMSVVPIESMHVNANFKEVQLRNVRIGQSVELISDFYGSSVIYHGKVIGISGGTGAAFAMIPAQNATGNWIKVVQRLPVRIELDASELKKNQLYVGLSMQVEINISDMKK
jgi:membrane fusion protein (multidrug efflux system)